uniref:Uncharacterized protein n=1 Tax=Arundo donax TaxID=35708 RepID=A0A0A8XR69_ARUDO
MRKQYSKSTTTISTGSLLHTNYHPSNSSSIHFSGAIITCNR